MAQAVFGDHHPVQDYLREETGEDDAFDATGPFFPGIHPTFDDTIYPLPPWDLRFFAPMFGIISATVRKERLQRKAAEEFAELFKYKLVSSALLSSGRGGTTTPSATATPTAFGGGMMMGSPSHPTNPLDLSRSSFISATGTAATTTVHNQRSEIPGRWNKPVPIIVQHHDDDDNDADSTITEDDSYFSFNTLFGSMTLDYHTWSHHTLPPFPLICLVILVILKFPFILAPFSLLFLPFISVHALEGSAASLAPVVEQDSYTDTLNSLDALIHASQTWDQTTLHAITLLLPPSSTSSSPLFPSPPLAHSLHTTLVQTSTHVNTIRSLLSALARSSKELQMLERMYGPQSPALLGRFPATGTGNGNGTNGTPVLLRSPSMPYTATNRYQPQTSPSSSRRPSSVAGHESMMTRSLGPGGSTPLAQSPSTTTTPSKHLSHLQRSSSVNSFHTALSPPTSSATSPMSAPTSPFTRYTPRRRSISKPSSLTNVRSNSLGGNLGGGGFDRDTLSGASLGQFRDSAKSAIRHTAGCLLGLRFLEGRRRRKRRGEKEEVQDSLTTISSPSSSRPTLGRRPSSHSFDSLLQVEEEEEVYDTEEDGHVEDDQDPSYWEDVRSVLALFRSALEDASDRLQDAIGDHQRGASALPSPPPSSPPMLYPNPPSHSHLLPTLKNDETGDLLETLRRRSRTSGGRDGFAPIPSALGTFLRHVDGMQDALSEVNISLKEAVEGLASSSPSSAASTHGVEKAYERVRTALGIALRECERGRGALGDHLRPAPPPSSVVTIPEEEDQRPDTPPLIGGDGEDDEGSSAEADVACTSPPPSGMTGNAMIIEGNHHEGEREGGPSLHTLLAEALLSIPPTGKEQVFEAETTTPTPNASPPRMITKLSRAERIQQVKAQRAAPPPPPVATTGMGPSTDVVQELKDVIWQVGERRRRSGLMMSSFKMVEEEDEEEPTRPPGLDGDEQHTQKQIQTRPLSY